jgi:hypothetical protein
VSAVGRLGSARCQSSSLLAACVHSDRGEGAAAAELEATGLIEQVATPSRGPTAHAAGAGAVSARDGRLTAREELSGRSGDSRCASERRDRPQSHRPPRRRADRRSRWEGCGMTSGAARSAEESHHRPRQ